MGLSLVGTGAIVLTGSRWAIPERDPGAGRILGQGPAPVNPKDRQVRSPTFNRLHLLTSATATRR